MVTRQDGDKLNNVKEMSLTVFSAAGGVSFSTAQSYHHPYDSCPITLGYKKSKPKEFPELPLSGFYYYLCFLSI